MNQDDFDLVESSLQEILEKTDLISKTNVRMHLDVNKMRLAVEGIEESVIVIKWVFLVAGLYGSVLVVISIFN